MNPKQDEANRNSVQISLSLRMIRLRCLFSTNSASFSTFNDVHSDLCNVWGQVLR
jgi:hypothetical protein